MLPGINLKDYRLPFLSYYIKQWHKSLLDVSCGEGKYLRYWRRKGLEVYGTEISEELVRKCHCASIPCKQVNLNNPNLRFPFDADSFDVVTCTEVLEHIYYPKAVIKELCRVAFDLVMITTPAGKSYWSPDHLNHWRHEDEFESDLLADLDYECQLYEIISKPEDYKYNDWSFVCVIDIGGH